MPSASRSARRAVGSVAGGGRVLGVATREAGCGQRLERLPHAAEAAEHLGRGEPRRAAVDQERVAAVGLTGDADRALAPGAARRSAPRGREARGRVRRRRRWAGSRHSPRPRNARSPLRRGSCRPNGRERRIGDVHSRRWPHARWIAGASPCAQWAFGQGVTTGRRSQPRTVEVRACTALSQSTSHVGKRLQHLVERDAALEPGQRRAEAEVDAVAEREVVVDLAVDVEAVAVGELAVVAVGRRR